MKKLLLTIISLSLLITMLASTAYIGQPVAEEPESNIIISEPDHEGSSGTIGINMADPGEFGKIKAGVNVRPVPCLQSGSRGYLTAGTIVRGGGDWPLDTCSHADCRSYDPNYWDYVITRSGISGFIRRSYVTWGDYKNQY